MQITAVTTPISESYVDARTFDDPGSRVARVELATRSDAICAQTDAVADDQQHPEKRPEGRKTQLRMTPGIVCSAINGYEKYKVLPKATQTSDEKLLVLLSAPGLPDRDG